MNEKVHIIGAGLAGSLMAVLLAKKGYAVRIYERRQDMRKNLIDGGRSINLALSARGLAALEYAGLKDEILELAIPMRGRMIHSATGELNYQPYSNDPDNYINSVSRAALNMRLMDAAEAQADTKIHFGLQCQEADFENETVALLDADSGDQIEIEGDIVLGCDGAFSAIRTAMQKTPRFNYSQDYLSHAYKELTIPPGKDGDYQLEPNALHIWPRGEFMMIALPNQDRSFTCTLFFPFQGPNSFAELKTQEDVETFFSKTFPDAIALIPDLWQDFRDNPVGDLVTVRCWPWTHGRKFALLGDAAHAIVPFFGQGMNASFEDCQVLNDCLEAANGDWPQAFAQYEAQRKPNTDAIAQMALENHLEMQDHVADPRFVFKSQVDHYLEQHHPAYKSRYEMVSFSCIPYAEVYRRGEINQTILDKITAGVDKIDDVDMEAADARIAELLS